MRARRVVSLVVMGLGFNGQRAGLVAGDLQYAVAVLRDGGV